MLGSKSFWMNLLEQIGYFLLAIVVFNSIGIWFPLLIDYYNGTSVTQATFNATPYNFMTYFMGLASVALIDRIKRLMKVKDYPAKFLEFLLWVFTGLTFMCFVFFVMKYIKDKQVSEAIRLSLCGTLLAYIIWWVAYYQPAKDSSYGALGHENIE